MAGRVAPTDLLTAAWWGGSAEKPRAATDRAGMRGGEGEGKEEEEEEWAGRVRSIHLQKALFHTSHFISSIHSH